METSPLPIASLTEPREKTTMRNEAAVLQLNDEVSRQYISSEVRFYTVEDVIKLTSWSENTVLKLFNDPMFPSADFGKAKIVEAHALIDYFSTKRCRNSERYWKKGEMTNELKRRIR